MNLPIMTGLVEPMTVDYGEDSLVAQAIDRQTEEIKRHTEATMKLADIQQRILERDDLIKSQTPKKETKTVELVCDEYGVPTGMIVTEVTQ